MSVKNTKIVDFISTNKDGDAVLTVSDHLKWNDEHLIILQQKLNAYLDLIKSEQLKENYQIDKTKKVIIKIALKYKPDKKVIFF